MIVLIVPLWNWNVLLQPAGRNGPAVLIVPLWNWNDSRLQLEWFKPGVLIVPLWNWNMRTEYPAYRITAGSNCTFMELKWCTH